MIAVNSYPELFTTILGWQQYQNLWDIISHTGLVFVPFIVMIIKNTVDPFLSQAAKSAYTTSLRRVEFSLGAMIIVIMIACQPMITLKPSVLHFNPVCNKNINATPDHSGTTYDSAFSNLKPVKVPLWWYAIIGISSGITASANVGIGCVPNLREEKIKLDLTRIKSAPLRAEVEEFFKACWLRSRTKYLQKKPDISQYTKKYGTDDTGWIGSHAFLNMPGYYDTFKASGPIKGFPYSHKKDWIQGKNDQWGTPTCQQWWEKPEVGLYVQLKKQISPSLWREVIEDFGGTNAADAAIKKIISTSVTNGYRNDASKMGAMMGGTVTGILAAGGLAWDSTVTYFPKMYVLFEALPLIQAYLLLVCYIFLAIALPACGYRFSTVFSLSFVIFSIIFWSYLWELARYVDSSMIKALSPIGGFSFKGTQNYGGTEVLTNMVAVLMYVVIPLFWTMFMGWAGVRVGNGATSFIDRASGMSSGAGGIAKSVVSRAASAASKSMPKSG